MGDEEVDHPVGCAPVTGRAVAVERLEVLERLGREGLLQVVGACVEDGVTDAEGDVGRGV